MSEPNSSQPSPLPQSKSAIDLAIHAINNKDYVTLAQAANQITAQLRERPFLIEPLIVVADHLWRGQAYTAAIFAASVVCAHVPRRSDPEQRAVEGILIHVDAFAATDVVQAVIAAQIACTYSPSGSALSQRAIESVMKHVDAAASINVAWAFDAISTAAVFARGELEQRVLAKKYELAKAPPRLDEDAARAFAEHFGFG